MQADITVEDLSDAQEAPDWLSKRFEDPSKVVIFRARNRGLLLTLSKSKRWTDADGRPQEQKGLQINFSKTGGFFATDDPEVIDKIKHSARYGIDFFDMNDVKKQVQEQNYQAFSADVADNPQLLERLIQEKPELVRQLMRRLGKQEGEEFEELEALVDDFEEEPHAETNP